MKTVIASSRALASTFRARAHVLANQLGVSMKKSADAYDVARLQQLLEQEHVSLRRLHDAQKRIDNIKAETAVIRERLGR